MKSQQGNVGIKFLQKSDVENQIPTPEFQVISANQKLDLEDEFFLKNNSFFVKPNSNGSSFYVSKVDHKKNLEKQLKKRENTLKT